MVSKVIWSTIIYGMNNILDGIAFITVPQSVFPADIIQEKKNFKINQSKYLLILDSSISFCKSRSMFIH